jgi:hypothetical protein
MAKKKSKSERTAKRTPNANSLANLVPAWPKGVSGNPGGRPRQLITDEYRKLADLVVPVELRRKLRIPKGADLTFAQATALSQFSAAIRGRTDASKEVTDRLEGKAKQEVRITNDAPLAGKPTDELESRMQELLRLELARQNGAAPAQA